MLRRIRPAASLLALAALTACADIALFDTTASETNILRLYGGQVVAVAPEDYCIARNVSRPSDGFAVMAGCDTATGVGADAVVTLQVGEPGTGLSTADATALRELLNGDAGRSLLSQTGNAAAIRVEATDIERDAVTVRFRDSDPAPIAGLQSTEWRGFFDLDGRLATIAVRGLQSAPLGTDDGEILLARTIAAVRQANEPGAVLVGG